MAYSPSEGQLAGQKLEAASCARQVEGAKRQVFEYLQTFMKYEWLWKEDMSAAYRAFMDKNPTLEDFESELKTYVNVNTEITRIPERNQVA